MRGPGYTEFFGTKIFQTLIGLDVFKLFGLIRGNGSPNYRSQSNVIRCPGHLALFGTKILQVLIDL